MTEPRPSPPPPVRWITRTLEDAGYETWAVGGAVRDVFMEIPSDDWDLSTRARPQDVQRLFRRTVPIGVDHGTVGVLKDGRMFEVTTFRLDVATDGRHAVVQFADRVEDDLARRDFTINALAWHALREVLVDPFGGRRDLSARILRAVGAPEQRFAEDHLRILRALRFAGRFRMRVEERTWGALQAAVGRLSSLSAERIREELIKVLDVDRAPSVALSLYLDSGALAILYPELAQLAAAQEEVWAHTLRALDLLPKGRPYLRLAALLHELSPREAAQIIMRLRLSNVQVEETARRAAAPALPAAGASGAEVRGWLAAVGPERVSAVARLELARALAGGGRDATADGVIASWRRARAVRAERPPLSVGQLELSGRDLIRLGLSPGPAFGRILDGLLAWVIEDPARNRKDLLESRAREITSGAEGAGA